MDEWISDEILYKINPYSYREIHEKIRRFEAMARAPPILIAAMNDWRTVTPFYLFFSASFSFLIVARMAIVSENTTPDNRATLFGIMNIA